MKQIIIGGTDDNPSPNNKRYLGIAAAQNSYWDSSETDTQQVIPTSGTFRNWRIKLDSASDSDH